MCTDENDVRRNRKGTGLGKPGRNGRGLYSRTGKRTEDTLETIQDNSESIQEPKVAESTQQIGDPPPKK